MDFNLSPEQVQIREQIARVCREFPDDYWRALDRKKDYPEAFVRKLTELGWLAALIPEEYGGTGLGITEGSIILEEINRSGGNATACHAQMYTMGTLLRHGSEEQKKRYLPKIAGGELRLQAFAVTEPNAGSDTTRIETTATKRGNKYVIHGEKVFISRVFESDLMLLLARTTRYQELDDKTQGLSVFLLDLREAKNTIEVKPLDLMINHHSNAVFFHGTGSGKKISSAKKAWDFATSLTAGMQREFWSPLRPSGMGSGSSSARPNTPGSAWSSAAP
jgi:acyl-CoA dehydrogenase